MSNPASHRASVFLDFGLKSVKNLQSAAQPLLEENLR